MKQKAMILSLVLASLISACREAEEEDTRSAFSDDLPKTDQAVVDFAMESLSVEQKWSDPVRIDPESGNFGPVSLFAPRPKAGEIVLSTVPIVEAGPADITISSPFFSAPGDCRATITNASPKEIQIHPSWCGVEIIYGERIGTLMAKDPAFISLISLTIPAGEARDFRFSLIPGLADLDGELRLFVHAVSTDPLEVMTVKSEPFEISNLKSAATSKSGPNKAE